MLGLYLPQSSLSISYICRAICFRQHHALQTFVLHSRAFDAIFFVHAPLVVKTASSIHAERPADHLTPLTEQEQTRVSSSSGTHTASQNPISSPQSSAGSRNSARTTETRVSGGGFVPRAQAKLSRSECAIARKGADAVWLRSNRT